MKIEVHKAMSEPLARMLRGWMSVAPSETGVCGEHDPRWLTVLERGLGHRPYVVVAKRDTVAGGDVSSGVAGFLPLALVSSRLFGRFLVSLPYINRAGVAAEDEKTAQALVEKAVELADELGVKYLELRHHVRVPGHEKLGFQRDEKQRMVLELPPDEEALWQAVGAKVRNQVRKGDKSELAIHWGRGPDCEAELAGFYEVFAVNMRDLGTPVYGRRLFREILSAFGDAAEIAVVKLGEQAIAGALLIHDEAGVGRAASTAVPSASSLRAFNNTNANMWMYHKLLLRAMERGSGEFDFGRSSEGSGTYRFKKQWGAEPQPTIWQYYLREGDVNAMRPDSAKNQRRVEMWKKLPVWVTRLAGPRIVRGIP